MAKEEDPDKHLYIGSRSRRVKQIDDDEDLFAMLIALYKEDPDNKSRLRRAKRLEAVPPGSSAKRRDAIRGVLSTGMRARREFAVKARIFLSERNAGDTIEKKRLLRGVGRARALISANDNAGTSRVRDLLNEAGRLGQTGALG